MLCLINRKKEISFFSSLLFFTAIIYFLSGCLQLQQSSAINDRIRDFDADWRFIKDSVNGAEQTTFNDSAWRKIDLPHDWSIEDIAVQDSDRTIGPFSK